MFPKLGQSGSGWAVWVWLGNILVPQPKWQTVGSLCLGLAQLVCPGLTLAEFGKIMNILFVINVCLSNNAIKQIAQILADLSELDFSIPKTNLVS